MGYVIGGNIVAKAIAAEGITHVFTLCGGHVQAIYEGCLHEGIRVVDVRHEQTAGHAADAWARLTGKPGVAIVTAGPGLTNTVTAVANAQRAQVPMVIMGGQAAKNVGLFGGQDRGGLQDMNHVELMRAVTKWSVSVPETRRLADYVQSAFRVAMSGVPGPVYLEMPIDILMSAVSEDDVIAYTGYRTSARTLGDPASISEAVAVLSRSERPLLLVGSQWRWSGSRDGLAKLLEVMPQPTFVSGMARGALSAEHPCSFKRARSKALKDADCVVVVGTPLDFRLGYGSRIPDGAKLIQIDLDGAEIGRNRKVDVGIVGDADAILGQLASHVRPEHVAARVAWLDRVRKIEEGLVASTAAELESDAEPINPMRLCAEINRFIDEKTIVIGDGGDFVATAAYTLDVKGLGNWMDPGPLGTLGVGPGYAMAAKLARPDHKVVILYGDGSFGFHAMEFEAMVRQGIPVVGIIGNDACWTQIHRGQVMVYGESHAVATTLDYTHYEGVVEAVGGHGEYVERLADLRPALERAFAAGTPALVNVKIGGSDFRKGALSV